MSNSEIILKRVRAGYKVRFHQGFYSDSYALCYPAGRWYPRLLLWLRKGVRLTGQEIAEVKAEIRRRQRAA